MKKVITIISLAILFIAFGCQKPDPSKELKPIVDKYIKAWNTGNTDLLDDIVDPMLIQHATTIYALDVVSIDSLKNEIIRIRKEFPDFHATFEDGIYNDNKFSIRATWTGSYYSPDYLPLNGRKIEVTVLSFYNIKDGKITDIWEVQNDLAMERQFGFTLKFEE